MSVAGRLDKVVLRTKVAFGVGATAEAISNYAFEAFTFFYYNQVLGLRGSLCGTAMLVAIIMDAITDPLMGSISDRWRSRLGRRHPFMFAAAIPVALVFYGLFAPIDSIQNPGVENMSGQYVLFAWYTGFAIMLRTSMTMFAVPHLAMGAELSTNYVERSRVMSYNNFFGWIGGAGASWIALSYFFNTTAEGVNGLTIQANYETFAAIAAFFGGALILASAWFTKDQIPNLPQAPDHLPKFQPLAVFPEMWQVLHNRSYLMLMLGFFFLAIMLGTRAGLGLHMNTFYWELKPEEIRWFIIASTAGYIAGFTLTARINRWLDKRLSIVWSCTGLAIFATLPVTLRLIGWMPENTDMIGMPGGSEVKLVLVVLIAVAVLAFASGSILNISVMSALADIADEHELTSKRRQEGIFYSARTFFAKSTSGIGHFVAGIALEVIQFPMNATPGEVPDDVIFGMGIVEGPLVMIPGLVAVLFYRRYNIDRKRHAEIQEQLAVMRAKAAE